MGLDEYPIAQSKTFWPSPQDYCEAVQTPRISFADEELVGGTVKTTALGLPVCMSGNFASVFCFQSGDRKVAVRCFLHDIADQEVRYAAISHYVLGDDLDSTVPFQYLEKGIQIKGQWFPILKMDWVDGITLSEFVAGNIRNGTALNLLAGYFKEMALDLERAGIAHGDLQHDNILVADDSLRLVDYDGMFVPGLKGQKACELGHASYQHPSRNLDTFDDYLDRFSAWVIYLSLKTISRDPQLYRKVGGGADCLLFRQSDLLEPDNSPVFQAMETHPDAEIRRYASALRRMLALSVEQVPSMSVPLADVVQGIIHEPSARKRAALTEIDEKYKALFGKMAATQREYSPNRRMPRVVEEFDSTPQKPRRTNNGRRASLLPDWIHLPAAAAQSPYAAVTVASPAVSASIDPDYPQFHVIKLPKFNSKTSLTECQQWLRPQLERGEQLRLMTEPRTDRTYSLNITMAVVMLGVVITNHQSWPWALFYWIYFLLCILLGFILARRYANHSICALTDRRLIYIQRGSNKEWSFTIPLEEISHLSPRSLLPTKLTRVDSPALLFARHKFRLQGKDENSLPLLLTQSDFVNLSQWLPTQAKHVGQGAGIPQAQLNLYSSHTLYKKLAGAFSSPTSSAMTTSTSPGIASTGLLSGSVPPLAPTSPVSALTLLSWANQQNHQWGTVPASATITHSGPATATAVPAAAMPVPWAAAATSQQSTTIPLILNVGQPANGITVQEASKLLGITTASKHIAPQDPLMLYGHPADPADLGSILVLTKDKDALPIP